MLREKIIESDQKYFMKVYNGRYNLVVDYGKGIKLYDKNGREYYDFLAGIGVNLLGHSHPQLLTALHDQINKVIHCSNLYYIEPQAVLEELLVNNSFADQVFFANSGAEANEAAIKLARRFFYTKGQNKYEIITTDRSFHGRTLTTLTATGQKKYQKPFKPLPGGFKYIPFNDLLSVKEAIGANTAAIMLEPIQGEGGVYPANIDYLQGLRKLCDQEGVLLIFDEVQTGLGRTGSLFAYQDYGIEPDIMTLAKGLGGGMPIGAVLAREDAAAFQAGDHGTTFGGNPLACSAGATVMEILLEDNFLTNVKHTGEYFQDRLIELKDDLPVEEVRGKGLMLALVLAENISAKVITNQLFKKGFLVNAVQEHTLRFLPPLIINKTDIDKLIKTLYQLLEEMV